MKKIMIIGAGKAQLNLLQAAKELNYCVVVCDMRDGTEVEKLADIYHKVNYMDKEAILEIAKKEKIAGVVSNSEPAMLTVAYVAENMGLPGNSVKSVETLLSKSKFRDLQRSIGAYAPQHFLVSTYEELIQKASGMKYPVIVKPTQCSGTRGTTRLNQFDESILRECYEVCKQFSRNDLVTVEEYVEMSCLRVNDTDVFVLGDEYIWDGWLWEDRSPETPMLPMTEIYPMAMPEVNKKEIRDTVNSLLKASGVRHGEFNVETYYTPSGELFVIEINPRQAGNYIPQLIEEHTGVSLTKLLVSTAVNDMSYYNELKTFEREYNYITLQVVFSKEDGIYDHLYISPEIEQYVMWKDIVAKQGDKIVKGINAAEAVAYVDLKFDSYEVQHKYTDRIEQYIYPVLK
jgi:biotin carboxylase